MKIFKKVCLLMALTQAPLVHGFISGHRREQRGFARTGLAESNGDMEFSDPVKEPAPKCRSSNTNATLLLKEEKIAPTINPVRPSEDCDTACHVVELVTDYSILVMAALVGGTFLLNIQGYAYHLTAHGLEFDTIAHLREQQDFHEILRTMRQ